MINRDRIPSHILLLVILWLIFTFRPLVWIAFGMCSMVIWTFMSFHQGSRDVFTNIALNNTSNDLVQQDHHLRQYIGTSTLWILNIYFRNSYLADLVSTIEDLNFLSNDNSKAVVSSSFILYYYNFHSVLKIWPSSIRPRTPSPILAPLIIDLGPMHSCQRYSSCVFFSFFFHGWKDLLPAYTGLFFPKGRNVFLHTWIFINLYHPSISNARGVTFVRTYLISLFIPSLGGFFILFLWEVYHHVWISNMSCFTKTHFSFLLSCTHRGVLM